MNNKNLLSCPHLKYLELSRSSMLPADSLLRHYQLKERNDLITNDSVSTLTNLVYLNVQENSLLHPSSLSQLMNLKILDMFGTFYIGWLIPKELSYLQNLRILQVGKSKREKEKEQRELGRSYIPEYEKCLTLLPGLQKFSWACDDEDLPTCQERVINELLQQLETIKEQCPDFSEVEILKNEYDVNFRPLAYDHGSEDFYQVKKIISQLIRIKERTINKKEDAECPYLRIKFPYADYIAPLSRKELENL